MNGKPFPTPADPLMQRPDPTKDDGSAARAAEMASKPILCIDFDGVIHSYEAGWQDGRIYGYATDGFWTWAAKAVQHFRLVIYSSRSKTSEGIAAMIAWLDEQWTLHASKFATMPERPAMTFAHEKPPAFLTIDDRAIQFRGDWQDLDPVLLRQYKVWNAPFDKDAFDREYEDRRVEREMEDMARAPWADRKVPWYLRMLGVPRGAYMGDRDRSYRTWWGEISFGAGMIALTLDRKHIHLAIPGVQAFIALPRWVRLKSEHDDHGGSWKDEKGRWFNARLEYGFSFRFGQDWGGATGYGSIAWGHRSKSFTMPWGWNKRRGDYLAEYLDAIGEWDTDNRRPREWHSEEAKLEMGREPWSIDGEFSYMLRGGKVQHVRATLCRVRRTDTYRVFGIVTRRRTLDEIDVHFHSEVGDRRGSWKGGAVGMHYAMKPGELPRETLARMQREMQGKFR